MVTRFYADAERGGTLSGSGTTIDDPILKLPGISGGVFLGGITDVALVAGSEWNYTSGSTGWQIAYPRGVKVRTVWRVGEESTPGARITALLYEPPNATGWTNIGGGRWQKTFPQTPSRVWAGVSSSSCHLIQGRNVFGAVSQPTDVTSEFKKHTTGATLTLYTGNAKPPPLHYGGIAISCTTVGQAGTLLIRSPKNTIIQDVGGFGGAPLLLQGSGSTNSYDTMLLRCSGQGASSNTSNIGFGTDGSTEFHDLVIDEAVADGMTSINENTGSSSGWGANNGISGAGACFNVNIRNFTVRGARHSGIQQKYKRSLLTAPFYDDLSRGVRFYGTAPGLAIIDCHDTDYCHAIDVEGYGWEVDRVKIIGQASRSQLGGSGTISRCEYLETQKGVVYKGRNQLIWAQNWIAGSNNDYRDVRKIVVDGCVFVNPEDEAIRVLRDNTAENKDPIRAGWDVNPILVRNCLIIDLTRGSRTASIMAEAQGTPFAASAVHVENTVFVTTSSTPLRIETANNSFTNYDVNSLPGHSNNIRATSLVNAGIDEKTYIPIHGGASWRKGVHSKYRKDPNDVWRANPPSIGPFEGS